jgi:hypothetical protein
MLFDTTINPFLHQSRLALLYRTANLVVENQKNWEIDGYFIHLLYTFFIAFIFFLKKWKGILILIATMLIDLDHLLVEPIFETNRCSINFHLLHTYYAMLINLLLLSKAF